MGIFASSTFRLRGNLPDGSINRLNLKWNDKFLNLSFGARTMGNKYIYANIDPAQVRRLTNFVLELSNKQAEHTYSLDVDKNNQLDCKITIGRDSDGIIYISFNKPQFDEVKYVFLPEKKYRWSENGQQLPNNEMSRRSAIDWAQALIVQLDIRMSRVKEEPTESRGNNNNNGGQRGGYSNNNYGNNNNNNNNGQSTASTQSFEDYVIS